MSKPMGDAAKNRAVGLRPFQTNGKMQAGGNGPDVWHGLRGTQIWGNRLPPSVKGPRPADAVHAAKLTPPSGKQIPKTQTQDRQNRNRV